MDPWPSDFSPSDSAHGDLANSADHLQIPGVLIADDSELVRNVLSLGLRRRGFEVFQAANGMQALETYAYHRDAISIAVLDIRMPELDGPQTLHCLHRLHPDLRVCFLTADTGIYEEKELLGMGAVHVFRKPVRIDYFADMLLHLVHGVPDHAGVI